MDKFCCPSSSLPSDGEAFAEQQWSKSAALGQKLDAKWEEFHSKSIHCCKDEKLLVNQYDSQVVLLQKDLDSETYKFRSLLILAQTAEAMASATIVQKLHISIEDKEKKGNGSPKRSIYAASLMKEQACNKLGLPVEAASRLRAETFFQILPCEKKQCRGIFIHGGICFIKKKSIRLARPNASVMGEKFCSNTNVGQTSAISERNFSICEESNVDMRTRFRRSGRYAPTPFSERLAAPLFESKRRKRVVLPERLGDFVIEIPKRMQK